MFPEPRISVVPDRVRSAGPQITRLAALGGIRLDEAQQLVASATAGVGADGRWSAFECVIFAPRQNLKTEYLLARILAGLYLFSEELIVFSAHRASTTTKVFKRLKRAIDRSPHLGSRIVRVSNRIGSESIELASGQTVEMVARSTSSGRGFTGDCIILDESHELDSDQLAAILPMVSTRKNPQVLYALSLGNEQTSHVGGLRERALSGRPGVCWLEWSMADDDSVEDRAVWARTNPAHHAGRISWSYMEREYEALGPDRFARERLGRSEWPSGEPGEWLIVGKDAWEACYAPDVSLGDPPVLVPAAAAVPSQGPDPFALWGPSGVPPWVRRGAITGASVGLWDGRGLAVARRSTAARSGPYTRGIAVNEVEFQAQFRAAGPPTLAGVLGRAVLPDRADLEEARAAEAEAAARAARREEMALVNAAAGDPLGELSRAQSATAAARDVVRDLESRLGEARRILAVAEENMAAWSGQADDVMTQVARRSSGDDDLLTPARLAHREFVKATRAAFAAVQGRQKAVR